MEIKKSMQPAQDVGFKGFQHRVSNTGKPGYDFNFVYDPKHWDCYVEFYHVNQNNYDYSYSVKKQDGQMKPYFTKQLSPNGTFIDPKKELKLKKSEPVAYRYKLVNKNDNKWVKYAKDDAASLCGDGCNLLTTKGTSVKLHGPMYLVMDDSFNPGYTYAGFHEDNTGEVVKDSNAKDLSKFTRTFANKADGNLAGIQQKVNDLKNIGYKRVIALPTTGGDNVSSHKYWIKRMFQTGNIDNYDSLNTELFKNGMNLVSDSAYTSQGLEGVNFQYAIKWMNPDDKPHEYYMFRMQGLQDAALGFGVVPKNMQNLRHKVINSPNKYEQLPNGQIKITENKEYNPKQPTYIQPYDNTMVSDEQRKDTKNIIRSYDKTGVTMIDPKTGEEVTNNLAINSHDDTLVPNAFIIDASEYDANIRNLNSINKNRPISDKIDLNSPMGTLVMCKFSGIEIRPKDEGGFVTWDSNTDMAKLSYTESDYDTKMLESIQNPAERAEEETRIARAHAGNRDMLTDGMRYWTKHVRNVQNEYTARTLGKLGGSPEEVQDRINSLIYNRKDQKLPDEAALSDEAAENIFYDDYKLRDKEEIYDTAVDKALMNTPLDSIEFADDTVGALSSPYLSKRSPDLEHIGESRYDAMLDDTFVVPEKYAKTYNKMNKVFTNQIHDFATKVLLDVDKNSDEKIFQNDSAKLTEYGQYIVPLVAGDIAKYAIIKSLVPNAEVKELKNGKLTYDYEKLNKEATLESMGIIGDSPEDEANQIINRIKKGTEELTGGDVSIVSRSIRDRFKNTNALSFRFAEAMVDGSGLGLDHRIDAAKDVADMDAVRNMDDTSDRQLSEVIEIWQPPIQAVKEENPSSAVFAEFTDLYDTMKATYGTHENVKAQNNPNSRARFKDAENIARTILLETGMNSEANYGHFFTAGLNTFGKDFVNQNGIDNDNNNTTEEQRVGLLAKALDQFSNMPVDYVQNAYTFGGNHDKPRMAECYGLDMALFHSNLDNHTTPTEIERRKTAYMIMNDMMFNSDLEQQNPEYGNKTGWDIIKNSDDYFNNVSPMAVAKGDWLRSSIGIANNIMKEERLAKAKTNDDRKEIEEDSNRIYAALSKSIKDVVRGDFYLNGENPNKDKEVADSYKKQLEKDGFGAKDFLTAFDIVEQQANAKYKLKDKTYLNNPEARKRFVQLVEKIGIGIPAAKVRMYNQMIAAIPGNPTVYAGDDFAMTGYEEKNHNVYLQNRNVVPWDVVDENSPHYKKYIAEHKKAIDGIVGTRNNDVDRKLEALNNGTMHKLEDLYGDSVDDKRPGKNLKCPAILTQAPDGSMAISVFNYNGIPLENPLLGKTIKTEKDLDNVLNIKSTPVDIDKLMLRGAKSGEKLEIPDGTKFYNIESTDPSYYESAHDDNGDCYLKRILIENGNKKYEKVHIGAATAPEGVLRLYYQPDDVKAEINKIKELEKKYTPQTDDTKKEPSFKGLKVRHYYNPQYNIAVSNPYSQHKETKMGENISIVSKG